MQDIFFEESAKTINEKSAKTKYIIGKTLSVISYALAIIWGILSISFFISIDKNWLINLIFVLIPLALFIFSGIFIGKIKDKFYVDYDYTFVSGSIRFSKVINNVKRKNIINFESKEIEKMGFIDSNEYARYNNSPNIIKHILTSNTIPYENKEFCFIFVTNKGEKYLLTIECSKDFILNIIKFANRTAFDSSFINDLTSGKRFGK